MPIRIPGFSSSKISTNVRRQDVGLGSEAGEHKALADIARTVGGVAGKLEKARTVAKDNSDSILFFSEAKTRINEKIAALGKPDTNGKVPVRTADIGPPENVSYDEAIAGIVDDEMSAIPDGEGSDVVKRRLGDDLTRYKSNTVTMGIQKRNLARTEGSVQVVGKLAESSATDLLNNPTSENYEDRINEVKVAVDSNYNALGEPLSIKEQDKAFQKITKSYVDGLMNSKQYGVAGRFLASNPASDRLGAGLKNALIKQLDSKQDLDNRKSVRGLEQQLGFAQKVVASGGDIDFTDVAPLLAKYRVANADKPEMVELFESTTAMAFGNKSFASSYITDPTKVQDLSVAANEVADKFGITDPTMKASVVGALEASFKKELATLREREGTDGANLYYEYDTDVQKAAKLAWSSPEKNIEYHALMDAKYDKAGVPSHMRKYLVTKVISPEIKLINKAFKSGNAEALTRPINALRALTGENFNQILMEAAVSKEQVIPQKAMALMYTPNLINQKKFAEALVSKDVDKNYRETFGSKKESDSDLADAREGILNSLQFLSAQAGGGNNTVAMANHLSTAYKYFRASKNHSDALEDTVSLVKDSFDEVQVGNSIVVTPKSFPNMKNMTSNFIKLFKSKDSKVHDRMEKLGMISIAPTGEATREDWKWDVGENGNFANNIALDGIELFKNQGGQKSINGKDGSRLSISFKDIQVIMTDPSMQDDIAKYALPETSDNTVERFKKQMKRRAQFQEF